MGLRNTSNYKLGLLELGYRSWALETLQHFSPPPCFSKNYNPLSQGSITSSPLRPRTSDGICSGESPASAADPGGPHRLQESRRRRRPAHHRRRRRRKPPLQVPAFVAAEFRCRTPPELSCPARRRWQPSRHPHSKPCEFHPFFSIKNMSSLSDAHLLCIDSWTIMWFLLIFFSKMSILQSLFVEN